MIKMTIALTLSAGVLLSGCAQQQQGNSQSQFINTEPDSSEHLNNVSYASLLVLPYGNSSISLPYGPEALQFGQLYLPENATWQTPAPLVVFVHGGCWLNAYDISHSRAFSETLAAEGFAVWSLEYRRTGDPGGGWPGSFDDILAGLRFVQTSLSAYPVDVGNVAITGHSAGGQLALLAASQSFHRAVPDNLPHVKGVIGLAAITDMLAYAKGDNSCQRATSQFLGGPPDGLVTAYQQATPQQQLMHPATLLLQGTTDNIVPVYQASASGMRYQLVENAGHFDWIHPQTQAYKQFVIMLQELLAQ